jgi:hypothetical protein
MGRSYAVLTSCTQLSCTQLFGQCTVRLQHALFWDALPGFASHRLRKEICGACFQPGGDEAHRKRPLLRCLAICRANLNKWAGQRLCYLLKRHLHARHAGVSFRTFVSSWNGMHANIPYVTDPSRVQAGTRRHAWEHGQNVSCTCSDWYLRHTVCVHSRRRTAEHASLRCWSRWQQHSVHFTTVCHSM